MNQPLRQPGLAISPSLRPQTGSLATPQGQSKLLRKYETAALLPDLSISHSTHVAPATALYEEATCAFARGTLIETVRGPVAIEDLLPGDYLVTDRAPEPILWIGSTTYVPDHTSDTTILHNLTRITAEAFGIAGPATDILMGPAARMLLKRDRLTALIGQSAVLVPVADYADGDRILEVTPGGAVALFHLMLPRHALIRVGGVEMESYHPGKSVAQSSDPRTRATFLSMFANLDDMYAFGDLGWTRTRRDVVDSLLDS